MTAVMDMASRVAASECPSPRLPQNAPAPAASECPSMLSDGRPVYISYDAAILQTGYKLLFTAALPSCKYQGSVVIDGVVVYRADTS